MYRYILSDTRRIEMCIYSFRIDDLKACDIVTLPPSSQNLYLHPQFSFLFLFSFIISLVLLFLINL